MNWTFKYEKDGKEVTESASIIENKPSAKGQDWETIIRCDSDQAIPPIVGVTKEQSNALAIEYFSIYFGKFELKNLDGTPFEWPIPKEDLELPPP